MRARERTTYVRDDDGRVKETFRESWVVETAGQIGGALGAGLYEILKLLLTSPLRFAVVAWRVLIWTDSRFPVVGLTFWLLLLWYFWPELIEIAENMRS